MDGLDRWWTHEVVHGYKGPLLLAFVAFVLTFIATRTITRLIRVGRGPFHNVSSDGVHLHHSTPGTILLVAGAFVQTGADGRSPWDYLAGAIIGIGASLVLDEFTMIFHLQDVYWAEEGQLSVNIVTLSAATVGLALFGVSPDSAHGVGETAIAVRWGVSAVLLIHLALVVITALKGKYPTALLGIFVMPLAWVASVRLARGSSPWARWFYSERRTAKATERAATFDARWRPIRQRWDDLVGGTPSLPDPASDANPLPPADRPDQPAR